MIFQLLLIAFFTVLLIVIYDLIQLSHIKIARNYLYSEKIADTITIAQLSDFHSNNHLNLDKLIGLIRKEEPDIILITGDIIEGNEKKLTIVEKFLTGLLSLDKPIFVIEGNHEVRSPNYTDLMELLNKYNIPLLRNQSATIKIKENVVTILGYCNGTSYEFSIDNDYYTIAMVHDPLCATKYSPHSDIFLTGHTHGGQVRIPFIGALFAPSQGLFPYYNKGLYEVDSRKIYVDSGLGWTRLPIRILNPVQFTIHTITGKSKIL